MSLNSRLCIFAILAQLLVISMAAVVEPEGSQQNYDFIDSEKPVEDIPHVKWNEVKRGFGSQESDEDEDEYSAEIEKENREPETTENKEAEMNDEVENFGEDLSDSENKHQEDLLIGAKDLSRMFGRRRCASYQQELRTYRKYRRMLYLARKNISKFTKERNENYALYKSYHNLRTRFCTGTVTTGTQSLCDEILSIYTASLNGYNIAKSKIATGRKNSRIYTRKLEKAFVALSRCMRY
ncbi:hypothetical protein TrispH2_009858 [Trichoplax sp. H2]|nr:hypothetical protein TrispH2_009858 [Trichoplax sp. H2]|eukprot:RDD38125.1 hypothetical protein TrispH2_009858 [Trichoplax sp. H2]